MNELLKAWPMLLAVAGIVALIMAWFATRELRKKMAAAQAETIAIYQQTLAAKDALALTLAETTSKQIHLLTEERKASDERHETVIAEYRANLHSVRNELQECTNRKAILMADLADLKARTDFKPVMDFLQDEHQKSMAVQRQILSTLSVIAPVLERVMESLRMPSDTARKVEIVNDDDHRVPVSPPRIP